MLDSFGKACDTWLCINHAKDIRIAPLDIACNFSMENIRTKYLEKIETIPMGLHGKSVRQFWDEDGEKFKELKENNLKQ